MMHIQVPCCLIVNTHLSHSTLSFTFPVSPDKWFIVKLVVESEPSDNVTLQEYVTQGYTLLNVMLSRYGVVATEPE